MVKKLYEILIGRTAINTDGDEPEKYTILGFRYNSNPELSVFAIRYESGQEREIPTHSCLNDLLSEDLLDNRKQTLPKFTASKETQMAAKKFIKRIKKGVITKRHPPNIKTTKDFDVNEASERFNGLICSKEFEDKMKAAYGSQKREYY